MGIIIILSYGLLMYLYGFYLGYSLFRHKKNKMKSNKYRQYKDDGGFYQFEFAKPVELKPNKDGNILLCFDITTGILYYDKNRSKPIARAKKYIQTYKQDNKL